MTNLYFISYSRQGTCSPIKGSHVIRRDQPIMNSHDLDLERDTLRLEYGDPDLFILGFSLLPPGEGVPRTYFLGYGWTQGILFGVGSVHLTLSEPIVDIPSLRFAEECIRAQRQFSDITVTHCQPMAFCTAEELADMSNV